MNRYLLILSLLLSFNLFAQMNSHGQMQMSSSGQEMSSAKKIVVNKSDLAHLDKAMDRYHQLHQSFVQYNETKVTQLAKEIKSEIEAIRDEELKKLLSFSAKTLGEMAMKSSEEQNKSRFHLISMAFINVVSKYQITKNYQSFYCPMVKMKWLQPEGEELQNPYSAEMVSCGEKIR